MKLHSSYAIGATFSLFLLPATQAIAKPVTAADLTGKSLCWSSGEKETYLAGGKFVSKGWGEGSWRLMSDGIVAIQSKSLEWTASIEKRADGGFERNASGSGWSNFWTGHYCN